LTGCGYHGKLAVTSKGDTMTILTTIVAFTAYGASGFIVVLPVIWAVAALITRLTGTE